MALVNKSKPSITMIAGHCCIRVHKMAMPLQSLGYKINLIVNKYPIILKQFYNSISVYDTQEHLSNAIKFIDPYTDIYHCHNEPNWFVSAVKEVSNKPVILDWHDSFLLRRSRSNKEKYRIMVDERNNAFLADGFNFPCTPMKNEIFHEFKTLKNKPNTILWSYLPKDFYQFNFDEWIGGICYQGRVDHPNIVKDEKYSFFTYCEYSKLAEELKNKQIPLYLYAVKNEIINWYAKRNLISGGGVYEFEQLIRKCASHDWGLIGNIDSHREWHNAMPNKLFEYIASQVPIVALNASYAGKWIEKEGIGINIKSLDELVNRWDERDQCRNTLIKKRLNYVMENHIHKLENLYANIL
ncbi:MAG: glycosyltransferase [Candidatus Kariarchaeaceae archaeon]|jgi:hypothetical protein